MLKVIRLLSCRQDLLQVLELTRFSGHGTSRAAAQRWGLHPRPASASLLK